MTEECAQEVLTPSVDRESILLSLDAWNTDGGRGSLSYDAQ